jgi:hypothetical protein
MRLKEDLEDPKTVERICAILIPHEYTRVDSIIDLVFSAASEVKQDDLKPETLDESQPEGQGNADVLADFRGACILRAEKYLKLTLVKRSASGYSSPDQTVGVVCAVSKEYVRPTHVRYWFAFHSHQDAFLKSFQNSYVALGCGAAEQILLIPYSDLSKLLGTFNVTERNSGIYWHIHVLKLPQGLTLERRKECGRLLVSSYLLP